MSDVSGIVALVAFILFVVLFRSWWAGLVQQDRQSLLLLLLLHPDSSGVDLEEFAKGRLGYRSIRLALSQLENEGLVFVREDFKDTKIRGYRTRYRYSLSPKGRIEAERLRASPTHAAD